LTFQLSKFSGAIELLSGNILIVTPCRVGHESGPSMGRVGLCRFGSGWVTKFLSCVGRVGSGPVPKISNKYIIHTQEAD